MRQFVRISAFALGIAGLAASMAILTTGSALAQAKLAQARPAQPRDAAAPTAQDAPIRQIALTEKQIEGVLAATREMDPLTDRLADDGKPDPKLIAKLDGVAKKNGFASYDDYNNVVDNIGLVLGGFDPATKKYIGPEAVIKAQIAQIEADKKMPASDRKEALAELNDALKSPAPPIENKGNIDLVTRYYDKLEDALGNDDE